MRSARCVATLLPLATLFAAAPDGEAVYKTNCASCHDGGVARAPSRAALKRMAPETVRFALVSGKMKMQAFNLDTAGIAAVTAFVTGKASPGAVPAQQGFCQAGETAFQDPFAKPYWNGWGGGSTQHRFQSAALAQLSPEQVPKLKLKWAFGFPNDTRAAAQPTLVGDRVFVGSQSRKVYSLDSKTGCIFWIFETDGPVRSAISIGAVESGWAAFFGDQRANAYAVDARTGKQIWKVKLDDHPAAIVTGAPALSQGRLYVPLASYEEVTGADPKYECCKFRGSVSALDSATGKLIWKSFTIAEEPHPVRKSKQGVQLWGPSGAGVWSSPTVDIRKRAVYVTTGDSYSDPAARTSDAFLAFDVETGKLLWSRQMTPNDAFTVDCASPVKTNCADASGPDFDFGSSPILVDLPNGRRALIAGQKSGMVHAVDPDQQGEVIWQARVGKGSVLGGVQWGSAVDNKNVYAAVSDVAFLSIVRPNVRLELDPKAGGGLTALDLATGARVWHTPHPGCGDRTGCSPAQSAAVTVIPGVVFSGSLDGHLRAYNAEDGAILWDFDTAHEFNTVNRIKAKGGAVDGPGAVVTNGMVFVNSGYSRLGGLPGNVLLMFAPEN